MYEKYFNKLREECLIRNRSSRTTDTYINNIRHFMKWTGYKSMEDLSLQDARSFILEKRNSGLSSATCNFYNSSICFLYKHVLHISTAYAIRFIISVLSAGAPYAWFIPMHPSPIAETFKSVPKIFFLIF